MRTLLAALPLLAAPLPAVAGTVTVQVIDQSGRPVADAVITIRPAAGVPAGPIRFPWAMTMGQQDIAFRPGTLIVPVGGTVTFPNRDKVRHQVYSFSKPARFEIKLFARDETRSYTFRTPGAVALGCNIHDRMAGFIKVVDTPFAGKTDSGGTVRLDGVAGGRAQMVVWHPRLRGKDNEQALATDVPATGGVSRRVQIVLR